MAKDSCPKVHLVFRAKKISDIHNATVSVNEVLFKQAHQNSLHTRLADEACLCQISRIPFPVWLYFWAKQSSRQALGSQDESCRSGYLIGRRCATQERKQSKNCK